MNLTQFIKQVDATVQERSPEELSRFIHHLAWGTPESEREHFLYSLQKPMECLTPSLDEDAGLSGLLSTIQDTLSQVREGNLFLDGEYNRAQDGWYGGNEFVFHDVFEIGPVLEQACSLVHQYIDRERYHEGWALARELFFLDIPVEGDYAVYSDEPLSIWDMQRKGFLSCSLRQLALDGLLSVYQVTSADERPETVYEVFSVIDIPLTLGELLQESQEQMEAIPEFLDQWIDYLGEHTGRDVDTLLAEALTLRNDPRQTLGAARKYSGQHPQIYEQLLKGGLEMGDDVTERQIGEEALRAIPVKYLVRSRVALLTAVHALRLNEQEQAEYCWLEAFRSDTAPVHYLRLVCNSRDFSVWRDETRQMYQNLFNTAVEYSPYFIQNPARPTENRIGKKAYCTLLFLDGKFPDVLQEGMNVKTPLGWSATFMKEGLTLFLLLLFRGETLPAGCRYLCQFLTEQIDFSSEVYAQGLLEPVKEADSERFWLCFRDWKQSFLPSEEQAAEWLERLERWIGWRVEGIVRNQHRAQYDESAAFVAALGEVRESRGEENGKTALLAAYRDAYPRHTAFCRELLAFGKPE